MFKTLQLSASKEGYVLIAIVVDAEYGKVLIINTHKLLYRFKRPPSAFKVTPTVFSKVMDTMLGECKYAAPFSDDILIKGEKMFLRE